MSIRVSCRASAAGKYRSARMILTWDQEKLITIDTGEIQVLLVWKWLAKNMTKKP